jgi:hypothetical protein
LILSVWIAIVLPKRQGRTSWWAIPLIVPFANIVSYFVYAFTLTTRDAEPELLSPKQLPEPPLQQSPAAIASHVFESEEPPGSSTDGVTFVRRAVVVTLTGCAVAAAVLGATLILRLETPSTSTTGKQGPIEIQYGTYTKQNAERRKEYIAASGLLIVGFLGSALIVARVKT